MPSNKALSTTAYSPDRTVNVKKVMSGGLLGLMVGGIYVLISEIAHVKFKPSQQLDPPAPNMEEINRDLANVFRTFMGSFYKMCAFEDRESYQYCIKEAIRYAENVMIIENQMRKGEIQGLGLRERTEAGAHAQLCMGWLRKTVTYFNTDILEKVTQKTDLIQVKLADSLLNIRNMSG